MYKKIAKTPPLGWNSWDCFGAAVTEAQLKANADYMAKYLKPCGWEYIVCDIQWYEPTADSNDYHPFAPLTLDAYGRLLPAENRFPSAANGKGFRPIADYCHRLGLKFGIHILRGVPREAVHRALPVKGTSFTCREIAHPFSVCSWNTDMYGLLDTPAAQSYYDSLFELYASWGVDFIKCDDICVTEFRKFDAPYSAAHEIEMLRRAIDRCGREMVLSLSPGPARLEDEPHLRAHADMWRLTGDFWDSWEQLHGMFAVCRRWQGVPGRGSWPDCDMLPLGRLCKNAAYHGPANRCTGFTKPEQQTMLTLWGIFKSPLMVGGNLPENDDWTLSLLTNRAYLEMQQNAYGARELLCDEKNGRGTVLWTACGKGCKYLAVFNTRDRTSAISADLREILMPDTPYTAAELWSGDVLRGVQNRLRTTVEPHGVKLFRFTK